MFRSHLFQLFLIVMCLLGGPFALNAQIQKEMIIGRTTGTFDLTENQRIRVSGFTNRLSGQVTLPGIAINKIVGDSVVIDFWNISQADPHDLVIDGIKTEKSSNWQHDIDDLSIHHMDHGYYRFVADQAGTHVYYCPIKYPFNVQAGMFGVLVIREKKLTEAELEEEKLWCGFELDTNWHTDALLDKEIYEPKEVYTMENFPPYSPQHFLINGVQEENASSSLAISDLTNAQIVLRIANTGLYKHEVNFPKPIEIKGMNKDLSDALTMLKDGTKITLEPFETVELIVSSSTEIDDIITYNFLNPTSGKTEFVQRIPIKLKNPSIN